MTLKNSNGLAIDLLNYGGIVTKILAPDRNGNFQNVVLGFDEPAKYVEKNPTYFGALVGRFANRIGGAAFEIDGTKYSLARNDGRNALHGGLKGFDKVYWTIEAEVPGRSVTLSYHSAHMEEGYPGNLTTTVTYSLGDQNEFSIDYTATTDQATHVNLTHHSYFNLSGDSSTTILDHLMQIDADRYTVSDQDCIPTGEIRELTDALDFRAPRAIGEQIKKTKDGYNHNYILNRPGLSAPAAVVRDPKSGRRMEVFTTEPGLQFYSAYFLDLPFNGFCLEAQHYPDSPNKPDFPKTILRPGEVYRQTTIYRFGV